METSDAAKPFYRHLTLRRLERCRDALARETWRPGIITQIAFAHGFINLSSFNRLFKKAYAVTPRGVTHGTAPLRSQH